MAVFQHLLQRWGFVKLARYGLVLTPENQILSMRPEVLDDGAGGRVVGWQDDDPAVAALAAWAPRTERSRLTAQPVTAPVMTAVSVTAPAPVAASAAVMPVAVAPAPVVDEDDWEWTIALARARVATEDAEAAAVAGPPPPRPSPSIARPTAAAVAMNASSASSAEWPKTEPIGAIDYDDYSRVSTQPGVAIPRSSPTVPTPASPRSAPTASTSALPRSTPTAPSSALPRGAVPSTVIPVPALPSIHGVGQTGRLEPVVRTASTKVPTASLHQLAKGTGSVMSDDTEPNISVGDRTKPGIALPPAAQAVQLPSVKRRMAARR